MALPRLIGIAGKQGAGKDTLAGYLVEAHGFRIMRFADPIKENFFAKYGIDPLQYEDRAWRERPNELLGWNPRTFKYFTPREILIWDGTEGGRHLIGGNVWVDVFERRWNDLNESKSEALGQPPHVCIPDVRFTNEARRIRELGGVVVRVERAEAKSSQPRHESEFGLPQDLVDVSITNNYSIAEFLSDAMEALHVVSFNKVRPGFRRSA